MPLRLHMAAHHAERPNRLARMRQEARDQGMERALSWREEIGVALDKREATAAILQREACSRYDDVGAERIKRGLDEAHHHPVGVGGAEIGGIAAQRIANLGQQRLLANQRATACGVRFGKQFS